LLKNVEEFIDEMKNFLPQVKNIFPSEVKELDDII